MTAAEVEPLPDGHVSLQQEAASWAVSAFGAQTLTDLPERTDRFAEEDVELLQACGMPQEWLHQMVDHVYSREPGEIPQEVGGVLMTLAVLCTARGIDLAQAWKTEQIGCWARIARIREKNQAKPRRDGR